MDRISRCKMYLISTFKNRFYRKIIIFEIKTWNIKVKDEENLCDNCTFQET